MANKLFRLKPLSKILAQAAANDSDDKLGLQRNLNVRDLTAFGVAAVIGSGIFGAIGQAINDGGPAISLLYVFTALACLFSALCYAQFASAIPISGSAYTYSYAVFGELIAWIIGWDLLMEYAIGNIAVAISWSDYFTGLLNGFGVNFPAYLSMDFVTAKKGYLEGLADVAKQGEAYTAYLTAPDLGGFKVIMDIPAFAVTIAITWLVFTGIKETKNASNFFVLLKLAVIFLVIIAGSFYVNPDNWTPFTPNGISGVLKGVSAVFFAYIGFDAISTSAEESKNPERDLPRAMLYSLAICTVVYVLVTLVLTGMVKYDTLAGGDPLAQAFFNLGQNTIGYIIAIGGVIAMASVFLVFQMGQPRIWMSMSRDGLLPPIFARIHPKYKTPWFSTLVTGLVVGIPCLFMNLQRVIDLTSIGTLFAFVLVSGGILLMRPEHIERAKFKVPFFNGRYWVPILIIAVFSGIWYFVNRDLFTDIFTVTPKDGESFFEALSHKLPLYAFLVAMVVITILSIMKNLSAIPVFGLLTNFYLMTEVGLSNWIGFLVWLVIGLVLYFAYGYWNSKLNEKPA